MHQWIQGAQAPLAPKIIFKIMQFSGNFELRAPALQNSAGPPDQNPVSAPVMPEYKRLSMAVQRPSAFLSSWSCSRIPLKIAGKAG